MVRLLYCVMLLAWVAATSCTKQKQLSKKELIAYINDKGNGLIKKEEIKGIMVQLTYRPGSLMVAQELGEGKAKDTMLIRKLEAKYKDHYYFILKFSKDKKEVIRQLGSFSRYSDMLQVFAFYMPQYINLTAAPSDTLPLADYYFDQTYGVKDGNTILLSFDKSKIAYKKTVDVNIGECGLGIGNLKFSFDVKDLDNVPKLNYRQIN